MKPDKLFLVADSGRNCLQGYIYLLQFSVWSLKVFQILRVALAEGAIVRDFL